MSEIHYTYIHIFIHRVVHTNIHYHIHHTTYRKGPAPPLAEKSENSHEDKAKEMEKGVHRLIEASADAVVAKNFQLALEKAKEAGKGKNSID